MPQKNNNNDIGENPYVVVWELHAKYSKTSPSSTITSSSDQKNQINFMPDISDILSSFTEQDFGLETNSEINEAVFAAMKQSYYPVWSRVEKSITSSFQPCDFKKYSKLFPPKVTEPKVKALIPEIDKVPFDFILSNNRQIPLKKHWKKWFQNPYFHLLFIQCESLDEYNKTIRTKLKEWAKFMKIMNYQHLIVYVPSDSGLLKKILKVNFFDKLKTEKFIEKDRLQKLSIGKVNPDGLISIPPEIISRIRNGILQEYANRCSRYLMEVRRFEEPDKFSEEERLKDLDKNPDGSMEGYIDDDDEIKSPVEVETTSSVLPDQPQPQQPAETQNLSKPAEGIVITTTNMDNVVPPIASPILQKPENSASLLQNLLLPIPGSANVNLNKSINFDNDQSTANLSTTFDDPDERDLETEKFNSSMDITLNISSCDTLIDDEINTKQIGLTSPQNLTKTIPALVALLNPGPPGAPSPSAGPLVNASNATRWNSQYIIIKEGLAITFSQFGLTVSAFTTYCELKKNIQSSLFSTFPTFIDIPNLTGTENKENKEKSKKGYTISSIFNVNFNAVHAALFSNSISEFDFNNYLFSRMEALLFSLHRPDEAAKQSLLYIPHMVQVLYINLLENALNAPKLENNKRKSFGKDQANPNDGDSNVQLQNPPRNAFEMLKSPQKLKEVNTKSMKLCYEFDKFTDDQFRAFFFICIWGFSASLCAIESCQKKVIEVDPNTLIVLCRALGDLYLFARHQLQTVGSLFGLEAVNAEKIIAKKLHGFSLENTSENREKLLTYNTEYDVPQRLKKIIGSQTEFDQQNLELITASTNVYKNGNRYRFFQNTNGEIASIRYRQKNMEEAERLLLGQYNQMLRDHWLELMDDVQFKLLDCYRLMLPLRRESYLKLCVHMLFLRQKQKLLEKESKYLQDISEMIRISQKVEEENNINDNSQNFQIEISDPSSQKSVVNSDMKNFIEFEIDSNYLQCSLLNLTERYNPTFTYTNGTKFVLECEFSTPISIDFQFPRVFLCLEKLFGKEKTSSPLISSVSMLQNRSRSAAFLDNQIETKNSHLCSNTPPFYNKNFSHHQSNNSSSPHKNGKQDSLFEDILAIQRNHSQIWIECHSVSLRQDHTSFLLESSSFLDHGTYYIVNVVFQVSDLLFFKVTLKNNAYSVPPSLGQSFFVTPSNEGGEQPQTFKKESVAPSFPPVLQQTTVPTTTTIPPLSTPVSSASQTAVAPPKNDAASHAIPPVVPERKRELPPKPTEQQQTPAQQKAEAEQQKKIETAEKNSSSSSNSCASPVDSDLKDVSTTNEKEEKEKPSKSNVTFAVDNSSSNSKETALKSGIETKRKRRDTISSKNSVNRRIYKLICEKPKKKTLPKINLIQKGKKNRAFLLGQRDFLGFQVKIPEDDQKISEFLFKFSFENSGNEIVPRISANKGEDGNQLIDALFDLEPNSQESTIFTIMPKQNKKPKDGKHEISVKFNQKDDDSISVSLEQIVEEPEEPEEQEILNYEIYETRESSLMKRKINGHSYTNEVCVKFFAPKKTGYFAKNSKIQFFIPVYSSKTATNSGNLEMRTLDIEMNHRVDGPTQPFWVLNQKKEICLQFFFPFFFFSNYKVSSFMHNVKVVTIQILIENATPFPLKFFPNYKWSSIPINSKDLHDKGKENCMDCEYSMELLEDINQAFCFTQKKNEDRFFTIEAEQMHSLVFQLKFTPKQDFNLENENTVFWRQNARFEIEYSSSQLESILPPCFEIQKFPSFFDIFFEQQIKEEFDVEIRLKSARNPAFIEEAPVDCEIVVKRTSKCKQLSTKGSREFIEIINNDESERSTIPDWFMSGKTKQLIFQQKEDTNASEEKQKDLPTDLRFNLTLLPLHCGYLNVPKPEITRYRPRNFAGNEKTATQAFSKTPRSAHGQENLSSQDISTLNPVPMEDISYDCEEKVETPADSLFAISKLFTTSINVKYFVNDQETSIKKLTIHPKICSGGSPLVSAPLTQLDTANYHQIFSQPPPKRLTTTASKKTYSHLDLQKKTPSTRSQMGTSGTSSLATDDQDINDDSSLDEIVPKSKHGSNRTNSPIDEKSLPKKTSSKKISNDDMMIATTAALELAGNDGSAPINSINNSNNNLSVRSLHFRTASGGGLPSSGPNSTISGKGYPSSTFSVPMSTTDGAENDLETMDLVSLNENSKMETNGEQTEFDQISAILELGTNN